MRTRFAAPLGIVVAAPFMVAPLVALQARGSQLAGAPCTATTWCTRPARPEAFTQGLIYRDGVLMRVPGRRSFHSPKGPPRDRKSCSAYALDKRYFAEGLTDWGRRLIQLTYTTNIGFVYDLSSLRAAHLYLYSSRWGLTHDRRRLIMSDGTSSIASWIPRHCVKPSGW